METAEKECGALGGLFQAIVNDMKVTGCASAIAGPLGARGGGQQCPAVSVRRGVCVSLSERDGPASAVRGGLLASIWGCGCSFVRVSMRSPGSPG